MRISASSGRPTLTSTPSLAISAFTVIGALCVASSQAWAEEPGLSDRDDIYMQTSFEDSNWYEQWGESSPPRNTSTVEDDPFSGDSVLRVHIDEGEHYGTGFGYYFEQMGHSEPEEVHFRYAIRLGPDWRLSDEHNGNGKLPGFGGTYGEGGWGGRPSDGTNGWSARMTFGAPSNDADRSTGETRIGYYTYHADQSGTYGDTFYFEGDTLEPGHVLHREKWYQVEGFVRMNTPGQNDGVLRAWLEGEQVLDQTGLRFRDVSDLKIEQVWFNIYVGGSWTAPQDQYVDFDNVVIAEEYIGPYDDGATDEPLFSDVPHFGDIRNYEFDAESRWSVVEADGDERLALNRPGPEREGDRLGEYGVAVDREFGDVELAFEAKSRESFEQNDAPDLAAIFGWQDEHNYYHFLANGEAQWTELFVVEDGQRRSLAVADRAGLPDEDWHDYRVERRGEQIDVHLDNQVLLTADDDTFGEGRVGVGSLNDTALFDDIAAVELDDDQPGDEPGDDVGPPDVGSDDADASNGGSVDDAGDTPNTGDSGSAGGDDDAGEASSAQEPSGCSAGYPLHRRPSPLAILVFALAWPIVLARRRLR